MTVIGTPSHAQSYYKDGQDWKDHGHEDQRPDRDRLVLFDREHDGCVLDRELSMKGFTSIQEKEQDEKDGTKDPIKEIGGVQSRRWVPEGIHLRGDGPWSLSSTKERLVTRVNRIEAAVLLVGLLGGTNECLFLKFLQRVKDYSAGSNEVRVCVCEEGEEGQGPFLLAFVLFDSRTGWNLNRGMQAENTSCRYTSHALLLDP